jgi:hypothetical protein
MDPLTLFYKRLQQYDSFFPELRKYLSKNPNITLQMVLQDIAQNPSKKHQWDFGWLAGYIPVKDLITHGFVFDSQQMKSVSMGKLDIELLISYPDIPWDWNFLTFNRHITIEDIAAHPEFPWVYKDLYLNPNFKMHPLVLEHETYMTVTTLSKVASAEEMKQYPNIPWHSVCLESPNMTDKHFLYEQFHRFYKGNSYSAVHWICNNPNMTFQELYDLCGTHKYFFGYVSENPNITLNDFLNYKQYDDLYDTNPSDKHWNLRYLSSTLPFEYILQHPRRKWYWKDVLTKNKSLTYDKLTEDVLDTIIHHHQFWEGRYLSCYDGKYYHRCNALMNKYMSYYDKKRLYEDMFMNKKPDQTELISHPLFLEPTFEEIRQYFAGKRIVRCVVEAVSNPVYEQCRKRLKREHDQLI